MVTRCTVSDDSVEREMPGSVLLRVDAEASRLDHRSPLGARGRWERASWDDAYSIPVAAVDQLVLGHGVPPTTPPPIMGVLVGTPRGLVAAPRSRPIDGSSRRRPRRSTRSGPAAPSWLGAGWRRARAGARHVPLSRWTAAGITKTETLRVVDPSEVVAIEVRQRHRPRILTSTRPL